MWAGRLMEPWVIALVSLLGGAFVGAISRAFVVGRNAVTVPDLEKVRNEIRADLAEERREVGEGLKAIRQKVTEVEIDLAKNYVRRDSWHKAMDQFQESLSKSDSADQQWKMRMEEKLDRMAERLPPPLKH